MATYSIDIGFNKERLRHPATSMAALLSQGVTVPHSRYKPPVFATGDQLEIKAYDLSAAPSTISAMSFELLFAPALEGQVEKSPVTVGRTLATFNIQRLGVQKSTVFQASGETFFITYDTCNSGSKAFPDSQLDDRGGPLLELGVEGSFYYTILLSVTWADDPVPKNFRVDPEMITTVHPGGPDDTPD